MKIIVKHKETEITVCEQDNPESTASIRWDDQNKRIQETITVMAEQVKKLQTNN